MSILVNGKKVAGIGLPGKSAYQYAVEGGYTGTEQEFGEKLAEECLPLTGGTISGEVLIDGSVAQKKSELKFTLWNRNMYPGERIGETSIFTEEALMDDDSGQTMYFGKQNCLSFQGICFSKSRAKEVTVNEETKYYAAFLGDCCINGLGDPVYTTDATNKRYVDNAISSAIGAALEASY